MNFLICKKPFYMNDILAFEPGNKYNISDYYNQDYKGYDINIIPNYTHHFITFSKYDTNTVEYRWCFRTNIYYVFDFFYDPEELRLLKLKSL